VHRSRTVNLAVVSALAASISGCFHEKKESVYCVDRNQEVVENQRCSTETRAGYYSYWYGPAGATFTRGQRVSGGTTIDASNKSANASRGGFGATAGSGVGGTVTRSSFSGGS
jgi:hypothetical protein